MYAIVMKVVKPARISVRQLVAWAAKSKYWASRWAGPWASRCFVLVRVGVRWWLLLAR